MRPIYFCLIFAVLLLVLASLARCAPKAPLECVTSALPDGTLVYCGPEVKCHTDRTANGATLSLCRIEPKDSE